MRNKPIYQMSQLGACPRLVVARRLDYDMVDPPVFMERAALEGVRHEGWVAEDLEKEGYRVSQSERCEECSRDGYHVEMNRSFYSLTGHIDRYAVKNSQDYLVEIKSLGRYRAEKLVAVLEGKNKDSFKVNFPEYSMQVSCYYYAAVFLPILVAVKNRDTGLLRVFEISPPYSLEEIDMVVLDLEVAARSEELPDCRYKAGEFERSICPIRYMCAGGDKPIVFPPVASNVEQAENDWREGKKLELKAKELLESANQVLLSLAKSRGAKVTLTPSGLKLTYSKETKTVTYPKGDLERVIPEELLKQVRKESSRKEFVKVEEVDK